VLMSTEDDGLAAAMERVFAELESQSRAEMLAEGADPDTLVVEWWVDARYRGQSFELRVGFTDWVAEYHTSHEERYGYQRPDTPVEAVTLRVVVTAPPAELEVPTLEQAGEPPPSTTSTVVFGGEAMDATRVWRSDLRAGHTLEGPAVVQEYSATTWIPPQWRAEVDAHGSLHLLRED
ncbi:MAG: hydantoinase/oxoprolinase family protein, partial [Gemmatimonadota bacterium]|nr:hydantoinase/oxoprolinase family protein [Gemmatimonadota bacterium]